MPPVVVAVAAAAAAYGASAAAVTAGLVEAASIGATLIGALASTVVSFVGNMLFNSTKSKSPQATTSSRTVTVRQAVSPRQKVYGFQRKGGVVTFLGLSGGSNDVFHIVLTLAGHECAWLGAMYINGLQATDINGNGIVSNPGVNQTNYTGLIAVEYKLGAPGEPAFPNLIAENIGWDANCRQDGCCSVHIALTWDASVFGGFDVSQVSFDMFGDNQIFDPRTGTTGFTNNAALCAADYLADPFFGMNADIDTEFNTDDLVAAANIADEYVDVTNTSAPFTVDSPSSVLTLTEPMQPAAEGTPSGMWAPLLGDQVTLSVDGGALPSGLSASVTYYWIPIGYIAGSLELDPTTPDTFTGYLAASLADALARNVITFTDDGSGTLTLTRIAEKRYSCDGTFSLDQTPLQILTGMLTALGGTAGRAIYTGGLWTIQAGAYSAPAVPLAEGDLRKDGFTVQAQASLRDYFTGVRGTFVNPSLDWSDDDYPPMTNAAAVTAANGVVAWNQMNLPMTISGSAAQRIATLELLRGALELQVPQLPAKLSGLQFRAGDAMMLSFARYGWVEMNFEVQAMGLALEQDQNGAPILGVDLGLKLTDPSAYTWDPSQAVLTPIAPKSLLPSPTAVGTPGVPSVTETQYVTSDGNSVKTSATIEWSASPDAYVRFYHTEFAPTGTGNWTVRPQLPPQPGENTDIVLDMAPGTYDFRVQAENSLGALSSYATVVGVEILGLSAAPADVLGFTVTGLSGFGIAKWQPSTDITVIHGGYGRIRWSPLTSGASWPNAIDIGPQVSADQTQESLPLVGGTFMMKWVNCNGVECADAASFLVTAAASLTVLANSETITESPTFGGVKTDCIVDGSVLKLNGSALIDPEPSWDAIPDFDSDGGIVALGTYAFASGIDLGSVKPVRLTALVALNSVNVLSQVDERIGDVDDWDDWDGPMAAAGSAQPYFYATDTDPTLSPVWGPRTPLCLAEVTHRAFKFDMDITTNDPSYNAEISTLSVTATNN